MRARPGDKVVVTGDQACLEHDLEPGTVGTVERQGYRPDVWLVNSPSGDGLRAAHEDDMRPLEGVPQPAPFRAFGVSFVPDPSVPEGQAVVMSEGATRETSSTGASKDSKLARFDMIPTYPLRLLAERYGAGAQKYPAVNGLDNWRNGYAWSLSYAAMQRHLTAFWGGEDIDPDSGQQHLAAVAWHAFVLMEWSRHPDLVEKFDDRQDPRSGAQ
ncbi:dATP/dGTP diphosphohydrolase domain-containing protein [Micromonospora sp. GCM10011541]|uniref:dATP/dGTP diphosphohydrolase domain-containing protein n=1 Tax=Micromonospora sp. GCM10011541 TaxID=3317336 RepID=UPI003608FEEB